MRVLFVTNSYPTTDMPGASPCIEQQKRALEQLGVVVDVLFFDGPKSRFNYLRALVRLFWLTQIRGNYDLIHAHYGLSGLVARAQLRCPIVVTFRGSDVLSKRERSISRWVAASVDSVIVMTDEMKRVLGRKDARVIPYGIDLELFKPSPQAEARQALGLPLEVPLILFPYNPQRREKRFDLVEQAVANLTEGFPCIRVLTVYGKAHREIPNYMNACDLMMLTSDTEGAPVAIREAMACNLPIVSVNVGDVAEIIRNTEGCHICPRTPEAIAEKLTQVLTAKKRTNGRLRMAQLDLSRVALDIAAIYQELVGKTQ